METRPSIASQDLTARARDILRELVEEYLDTGEPVGSRTLSQRLPSSLSPASIRNVMADLERAGLLHSPHTSAGRVPTHAGLRLFVDGLLELGDLSEDERATIEARLGSTDRTVEGLLTEASALLSGLSRCAGLVVAPKRDDALRHVEFVALAPGKALVVIVAADGAVENRVIDVPLGLPQSALIEASNYLGNRLKGRTLDAAREDILSEIDQQRAELDALTARIVADGLATWSEPGQEGVRAEPEKVLIVRGASKLLDDVSAQADLDRIRLLFDDIERKRELIELLENAEAADGVRIFIGAETRLFSLSGSSVIAAPYRDARARVIGAIGVIGPTRVNYGRLIPMVDYTARIVGRLLR